MRLKFCMISQGGVVQGALTVHVVLRTWPLRPVSQFLHFFCSSVDSHEQLPPTGMGIWAQVSAVPGRHLGPGLGLDTGSDVIAV